MYFLRCVFLFFVILEGTNSYNCQESIHVSLVQVYTPRDREPIRPSSRRTTGTVAVTAVGTLFFEIEWKPLQLTILGAGNLRNADFWLPFYRSPT